MISINKADFNPVLHLIFFIARATVLWKIIVEPDKKSEYLLLKIIENLAQVGNQSK